MQEIMQFVGRHPVLSIAWIALLVAVLPLLIRTIARKVKRSRVESSIFNSVQTGKTR